MTRQVGTDGKCGGVVLYELDVPVMDVELLPSLGFFNVNR